MAIFVVAHGAWSAGWAWRKMHPPMRAAGHELWTPTMTGIGERGHLAARTVDLETHIADMLAVLEFDDLRDVVLVGHSYGGIVATAVADRARDRVARLVYLDAFVPEDGQSLLDLAPRETRQAMRAAARDEGEGWLVPPNPIPADTADADAEWIRRRRMPHPLASFEAPLRMTGGAIAQPRSYIYCTRVVPGDPFRRFAEHARTSPGWTCHELDASHSPHVTAPERLRDLLIRTLEDRG